MSWKDVCVGCAEKCEHYSETRAVLVEETECWVCKVGEDVEGGSYHS